MDGNIIGRWINVETVRLYDGDMIAYIVFISKQALGPDWYKDAVLSTKEIPPQWDFLC